MVSFVLFFVFLTFNIFLTHHVEATYPTSDIAHWGLSVSGEKNDPDYKKVQSLVEQKKYNEALILLDKKTKASPKEATPIILKAMVLYEQGMAKKSLEILLMGFNMERQHPALHFAFCQIHRKLGNAKISGRACIIAAQQHNKNALAHYEYAKTAKAMGDNQIALKELEEAENLDQKNSTYPYQKGMIFIYLNNNADAENEFKKALSLDEKNIDAAYQLAYLYATQNKKELSNFYTKKILEMRLNHPKVESAKLLRGLVNKNSTKKLPAKIEPSQYHFGLSKSYYQKKEYGLSIIEIETAAKLKPNDEKIQEVLLGMYSLFLRLDKAEISVSQLISSAKDNDHIKSRGYQEWGDISILQGKLEIAKQKYEKAQKLGDPKGIAKTTLAEFPDTDTAIKKIPLNPNELFIDPINALNRKGEIFAHFGIYQRALGIYSLILRMDSSNLTALLNMATVNYKIEKYNRTISILERLLVIYPNHKNIISHRILLARSYVMKGDLGEGMKNLDIAIKLNPNTKRIIAIDPVFKKLQGLEEFQLLING